MARVSVLRLAENSRVEGSVQLKNGQIAGLARIISSRINGDLQFESNDAWMVARNNTIGANLQCKENNPPPTGGGNTAGDKEDQCAAL